MKMMKGSWSTTVLKVLLVAALPMHVGTYKILLIPLFGKSHVFSMAVMAEGLVDRGHKVTLFIGEHLQLNLPELRNRTEISVVRYGDTTDGVYMDYDAMDEDCSKSAIESGGAIQQQITSILSKVCVHSLTVNLTEFCKYLYSTNPSIRPFCGSHLSNFFHKRR